jgi:hypothetical protein
MQGCWSMARALSRAKSSAIHAGHSRADEYRRRLDQRGKGDDITATRGLLRSTGRRYRRSAETSQTITNVLRSTAYVRL